MKIDIKINKDLEVSVEIDDKLVNPKKETKKISKGEFGIQKKGAGDKAAEDLTKQANNSNS